MSQYFVISSIHYILWFGLCDRLSFHPFNVPENGGDLFWSAVVPFALISGQKCVTQQWISHPILISSHRVHTILCNSDHDLNYCSSHNQPIPEGNDFLESSFNDYYEKYGSSDAILDNALMDIGGISKYWGIRRLINHLIETHKRK